jgi:hypothetical protein
MHPAVCKFISVSSHSFLLYNLILSGYLKLRIHLPRQAVQRSPAGLLDPAHDDSTSLRNSSKYSSADAVKHRRKLECWQHRCKNVKSRIPYTWIFCWDIQNLVRLQTSRSLQYKLLSSFQQGTPCSAVQYKCASLSEVPAVSVILSQLLMLSVSRNV